MLLERIFCLKLILAKRARNLDAKKYGFLSIT
jgi:hypothetical protein